MGIKTVRKIVKIDEEKCNGCGVCVPACAEGAIEIINGKARLISEQYCDGLGACLGECPEGAITIEEREADKFNEESVREHLHSKEHTEETLPCGCPSTVVSQFERQDTSCEVPAQSEHLYSRLAHWPVQLTLVPPKAPFLQDADLVLAADCVPFAYAGFHRDFLTDRALLVACPKLDDYQAHLTKLTEILRQSTIKSITVVRMQVACCSGLMHMAKEAIKASGKDINLSEKVITIRGEIES